MPIKLACSCGRQLTLKPTLAGKKIRCPSCDEVLSVPSGKKKKVVRRSRRERKTTRSDPWDLDRFGVRQETPPVYMPAPVRQDAKKKQRKRKPDYTSSVPRDESNDGGFHVDSAVIHMLIGGLICFAGIAATAFSYDSANPGGGYYVFYRAIVFGGIQFFRGLFDAIT